MAKAKTTQQSTAKPRTLGELRRAGGKPWREFQEQLQEAFVPLRAWLQSDEPERLQAHWVQYGGNREMAKLLSKNPTALMAHWREHGGDPDEGLHIIRQVYDDDADAAGRRRAGHTPAGGRPPKKRIAKATVKRLHAAALDRDYDDVTETVALDMDLPVNDVRGWCRSFKW